MSNSSQLLPTTSPVITSDPFEHTMDPIVRLWVYRILVPMNGMARIVGESGFSDNSIGVGLGYEKFFVGYQQEDEDFNKWKVRAKMRRTYVALEVQADELQAPTLLQKNLKVLADLIGLNEVEVALFQFFLYLSSDPVLEQVTHAMGHMSVKQIYRFLSSLLHLPQEAILHALKVDSVLIRSGLLTFNRNGFSHLNWMGAKSLPQRMELLSDNFCDYLMNQSADPVQLIKEAVMSSSPAQLSLDDFPHMGKTLHVLLPYLQHVLESKRKGVNIFIYGAPGTGKSQLVKVLAKHFGCELLEVSSEDKSGSQISGQQRFRSYRAAQCFFESKKALLLFDEVEDVLDFEEDMDFFFFGPYRTYKNGKAWINRALEENPVPTFWLSNASGMDKAYLRRFDMVIEMPMPTRQHRKKLLEESCGDLLSEKTTARFAEAEDLSPAVIQRAASVVSAIRQQLDAGETATSSEQALELLMNNTLRVQRYKRIPKADSHALPDFYSPAYVNANVDIQGIAEGIRENKNARICLYGPPGTGKTAYGHWLAETLNMPLLVKRVSDLQSMWLGECEKNIAAAFEQAEREHALLLIDEVDSFLQDRRGAQFSWQVSQVNEMLTQMESFSGVFIASTNLMQGLDQASLRRFDLKIHFDYLLTEQAWHLMQAVAKDLALEPPSEEILVDIALLKNITPGDFAAVKRRHRFKPIRSTEELFAALENECSLKEDKQRAIGFH